MSEARLQRRRKKAYGRQVGGSVRTDLIESGTSIADHPAARVVADGIAAWLASPSRVCFVCKGPVKGDAAAYLIATSPRRPREAGVSGCCDACWQLPLSEIQIGAERVLKGLLPAGVWLDPIPEMQSRPIREGPSG